jgi:putative acetyltransferase
VRFVTRVRHEELWAVRRIERCSHWPGLTQEYSCSASAERAPTTAIDWSTSGGVRRSRRTGFFPPELEALLPEVRDLNLETLQTWVLCAPDSEAVGFLVMQGREVDALFITPQWVRRGGGTLLLRHARQIAGPLTVEVNEQNIDAVEFYLARGFQIVRRTPTDRAGRPYPLLCLEETRVATFVQAAEL